MGSSGLDPEVEEAYFNKAVSNGLDPNKDPVGAWLASVCSAWAFLFEISILLSFFFPILIPIPIILFFFLLLACKNLSRYNQSTILIPIVMSLVMAPITGTNAFLTLAGGMKK